RLPWGPFLLSWDNLDDATSLAQVSRNGPAPRTAPSPNRRACCRLRDRTGTGPGALSAFGVAARPGGSGRGVQRRRWRMALSDCRARQKWRAADSRTPIAFPRTRRRARPVAPLCPDQASAARLARREGDRARRRGTAAGVDGANTG